jgi:hypothetical protein
LLKGVAEFLRARFEAERMERSIVFLLEFAIMGRFKVVRQVLRVEQEPLGEVGGPVAFTGDQPLGVCLGLWSEFLEGRLGTR